MDIMIENFLPLFPLIDTPALLVDHSCLLGNIGKMQKIADNTDVHLRPHIKTHKSVYIAKKQLEKGAVGITVAKLGEAEVMSKAGINDIFIANQLAHPLKLHRLFILHKKINVSIGMDNVEQICLLNKIFTNPDRPLNILIEIDCGFNRCGIEPGIKLIDLASHVIKEPGLKLKGIFTHAGQVYRANSLSEVQQIGAEEGRIMQKAKNLLKAHGINIETVSAGSTPTAKYAAENPEVNEIRPGNYVFYDNTQLNLKTCMLNECSMFLLATVISQPANQRIIIDAGSKSLSLDQGIPVPQSLKNYGKLLNIDGAIVQLSEEHGIIHLNKPQKIEIGSPVLIIPNHACPVTNLFYFYYLIENNKIIKQINIDARGKSQ
jgi:D-serine deaminase-like pyridoxal phosphate-dependent protein